MNDLKKQAPKIQQLYAQRVKDVADRIHVKYFPPGQLTVSGVRSYIKKLEAIGFYPKLVVVDYIDLLRPTQHFDASEDLAAQGACMVELRGLMGELDKACWTACQMNRPGFDVEVVDLQHVAGALKKLMDADVVATLCQTPEEAIQGVMRIFMAKNRNGYRGMEFHIKLNTAQCRVIEIPAPVRIQNPSKNQPRAGKKAMAAVAPVIPTIRRLKTAPAAALATV